MKSKYHVIDIKIIILFVKKYELELNNISFRTLDSIYQIVCTALDFLNLLLSLSYSKELLVYEFNTFAVHYFSHL